MKVDQKRFPKMYNLQKRLDKAGVKYTVQSFSKNEVSFITPERICLASSLFMCDSFEMYNPNKKRIAEAF